MHSQIERVPWGQKTMSVECLKCYESVASPISFVDQLLSHMLSHKTMTSQRLAHWITNTMEDAGWQSWLSSWSLPSNITAAEKGVLIPSCQVVFCGSNLPDLGYAHGMTFVSLLRLCLWSDICLGITQAMSIYRNLLVMFWSAPHVCTVLTSNGAYIWIQTTQW